jgi:phage shock protein PspC (stress-responsive transcriptional regulator)
MVYDLFVLSRVPRRVIVIISYKSIVKLKVIGTAGGLAQYYDLRHVH